MVSCETNAMLPCQTPSFFASNRMSCGGHEHASLFQMMFQSRCCGMQSGVSSKQLQIILDILLEKLKELVSSLSDIFFRV